jgi:outer membrane biosynthesis protein TonB
MSRALPAPLVATLLMSCAPAPASRAPELSEPATVSVPALPAQPEANDAPPPPRSAAASPDDALFCDHDAPADAGPPPDGTKIRLEAGKAERKPSDIQAVIRDKYDLLRKCYEAALARDPQAAGKVTVRFVIDRQGAVNEACVKDSSLADATAVACMLEQYRQLRFAPANGQTTVIYPVVFSPG